MRKFFRFLATQNAICLILALFALCPSWASCASPSSVGAINTAPAQALEIDGHPEAVQAYDFGSISTLQLAPISRIFTLRNSEPLSVTITELRSACGCTIAMAQRHVMLPIVMAPGQTATVRVIVDLAGLPPGPVSKSVWVYVKDQGAPAATLTMTGTLVPAARLAPASLNFGQPASGGSPTVLLTVTWNNAALPTGSRCHLVSTNPEVSVTSVSTSAAAFGETYQCTLSPQAHLGELEGSVQAIVTLPKRKPVIVGEVPLHGEVRGDVAAAPAIVAFGTVAAGQTALRQINLSLTRAELPVVTSASPYLTARLGTMIAQQPERPFGSGPLNATGHAESIEAKPFQATLDITLSSKAPAGPLTTELTVTTKTGQRLRVPVFALIAPPETKR